MPTARVASLHDFADGEMRTVTVGDTEVLLTRVDGTFHACGARCTHYGAPLADGVLHGCIVICPWHHAQFDVTTGALDAPPALDALTRYEVFTEGRDVFVRVPDDAEETPEGASVRESGGHAPAHAHRDESDDRTFVIVGGGAAGEAAAEALREFGYTGRLVLVTQEEVRPYDRTKLSKAFLSGDAESDALPLRDEAFYDRHDIEVLHSAAVTLLDAAERRIEFEDGEVLGYDRALVATGGTPRTLDVPGADRNGVYLLRSRADAERIVAEAKEAQRVVIVGSSFIGMEAAASLTQRGAEVTVVSKDAVPFEGVLGKEVGGLFQRVHEENGVTFHLDASIEAIEEDVDGLRVTFGGGDAVSGDLVLVGIGVSPATGFLDGVTTHEKDGGVIVDTHLAAGSGLWAAGDIAHVPDSRSGERVRIEHWRLAQQHGRIAARNMAGESVAYRGMPFFWSGQFGVSLRYVGHAEDWDEVILDGDLDDKKFIAYYVQGGTVRAAAGVGRDKEMAALHALMLDDATPTADEVRSGVDVLARLK